MTNLDYTKFSVKHRDDEPVVIEPEIEMVPDPIEETKHGVVTDCVRLNVRKEPNIKAEVVCEITAATDIVVDEMESTDEFYKIYTSAGVEGYCMKKFITLIP